MGILLGFAPFILFSLLTGLSVSLALWIAFAAAFAIGIRDFLHDKTLRTLDMGCLSLFALLALYYGFVQPGLNVQTVRLIADAGLLLTALVSIAMRNPFTLQYAREEVPEESWGERDFLRANYILSLIWALAFAIMAGADTYTIINHGFSLSLDVAVGLGVLALAIGFTVRNPASGIHAARPR